MTDVLLTIGGSDSSGGAGIQADVKTFSVLGAHGVSVVTAVTAQNTMGVRSIFGLGREAVSAQLDAILEDFSIGYAKTGMLHSADIVSLVADRIEYAGIGLVLDPVMEAEAGGRLLDREAAEVLRRRLVPLARVVTPNIFEAEALSEVPVTDEESAAKAANEILRLGAEAVIVTGGHLEGPDILMEGNRVRLIGGERVSGGGHGVGCTYSAAITAFLARGLSLSEAASRAREFAAASISRSHRVGRGASPVNQAGRLVEDAERFFVLTEVERAVGSLMEESSLRLLIPEVGSNVGMAISAATGSGDVAAVEGRLVRAGQKVHQSGCVRFGASDHVARIILAAMSFDSKIRAAMNVRFDGAVLEVCEDRGLKVASFDRMEEPTGADTMSWGTQQAIREYGSVPEVIWDAGGVGKEPMIRLLGVTAGEVSTLAIRISRTLDGNL